MSTTSTFAILSLVFAFFFPLLAVIFGHVAQSEIRKSSGYKTGSGLALSGLIIGYIGLALSAALVIFVFALARK